MCSGCQSLDKKRGDDMNEKFPIRRFYDDAGDISEHFSISIDRCDEPDGQSIARVSNHGWDWSIWEWRGMRNILRLLEGDRVASDGIAQLFHEIQIDEKRQAEIGGVGVILDMMIPLSDAKASTTIVT